MAGTNVPSSIYQIKISLSRSKPPVWRRVQVPEDYTFHQLHLVIQKVMGWSNSHLHQFVVKNSCPKDLFSPRETIIGQGQSSWSINEKNTKIANYFSLESGDVKASYEYDFGSTWYHDVLLEKVLPAKANTEYPKCIAGRQATPPEDPTESELEDYDPKEKTKFDPK